MKLVNHQVPQDDFFCVDYLVQNLFVEWWSKRHISARGVWLIDVLVSVGGPDDELLGSEERPKVCIKVLFLQAGLAIGGRPQLDWVGGDLDIQQA